MNLKFARDRERYNPLIAGERRYLRKTETASIGKAAEDPRNGGGSS
jgi:hypothetical protein